jgi:hypothetical protein
VNWIHLAEDRVKLWAHVNAAVNFLDLEKARNLLPLSDYPFADQSDRAVWLMEILRWFKHRDRELFCLSFHV